MTQASIDKHPDVLELRARYEAAGETAQAHLLNGFTLMAGLYLAISPWVIQFSGAAFDVAMSNLVTGVAVALLAVGFASAFARTHSVAWVVPLIGTWAVVAPFAILGGAVTQGLVLSNVIVGIVTILLGIGLGSLVLMGGKS